MDLLGLMELSRNHTHVALRRDECKILQDGLESLYLCWFQLFKAYELIPRLSMSYKLNSQDYTQQYLQHCDAD